MNGSPGARGPERVALVMHVDAVEMAEAAGRVETESMLVNSRSATGRMGRCT